MKVRKHHNIMINIHPSLIDFRDNKVNDVYLNMSFELKNSNGKKILRLKQEVDNLSFDIAFINQNTILLPVDQFIEKLKNKEQGEISTVNPRLKISTNDKCIFIRFANGSLIKVNNYDKTRESLIKIIYELSNFAKKY